GVRDVAERAGAKAEHALVAVRHLDRQQLESGDADRLPRLELMELEVRPARAGRRAVRRIEDVVEPPSQESCGLRVRVDGERLAAAPGEDAQVVDAVAVVRVCVREPHRIDVPDALAQQLDAQFGRRVDEEGATVALEQRGVPRPFVARVIRRARGTRAADDRHTERGAGPEEAQPHSTSTRSMFVVPGTWNGTPAVTTTRCPGCAMRVRSRYSRPASSIDS